MFLMFVKYVLRLIDVDLSFNGEIVYVTLKFGDTILIERTFPVIPHMRKDYKVSARGEM